MEGLKYVSPEYQLRLENLARLLCPRVEEVHINPLSIPRDEEYSFQFDVEDTIIGFDLSGNFHHPRNRWDSMGNYTVDV